MIPDIDTRHRHAFIMSMSGFSFAQQQYKTVTRMQMMLDAGQPVLILGSMTCRA